METSKVYFTNLRTTPSSNLLDKMERLVKRAGIANIDFQNQFVAIKIHFGEPGNLAFIRPNYAARMATLLRNLGAKPFLTDCNTLYSILKVKVNLCSQIVRGIDGLNLPDMAGAGAAWKKLFWRRDEQREKRKLTLPDGFYRLTYKGLSKTSNRLGYFIYTDKGVDEPQHCVLHTNRIFQVPGGTLEGLFTIGDEITAQVFSCEEFSGYQIDLRN